MQIDSNANYWIARGQEVFGPYSGRQVREYLGSGNIVPSDMIRGEHDSEWSSVAAVLGLPMPPSGAPYPGGGAGAPSAGATPDPGRMWAFWSIGTSAFGILCCSCGSPIGIILGVVALIVGGNESRKLAWTGLAIGIIGLILNIALAIVMAAYPELNPFAKLLPQFAPS
jgi:GYF domain 2